MLKSVNCVVREEGLGARIGDTWRDNDEGPSLVVGHFYEKAGDEENVVLSRFTSGTSLRKRIPANELEGVLTRGE